jgi:aminopeptidase N
LCEKKENKTVDEYVYQYQHNRHYNAKREAIEALKDSVRVNEKAAALFHQALQDPFFGLRKDALNYIGHDSTSKFLFLNAIERMAGSDSSNRVRQDALSYLAKLKVRQVYANVYAYAIRLFLQMCKCCIIGYQ